MNEITGDSGEYELLELGVMLSKDIPGMCIEIGLRMGLGTKTIIDAVRVHCPDKTVVAIDPYGSILYRVREMNEPCRLDYDNGMKYRCLSALYTYLIDNPVDFHFFDVEDTVFFEKHANGIEKYNLEKTVLTDYSLVFYDGPHDVESIKKEIDFFLPRTPKGGIWIFDDCTPDFYDHPKIEDYMGINDEDGDFERIHKGHKKAIYRRL